MDRRVVLKNDVRSMGDQGFLCLNEKSEDGFGTKVLLDAYRDVQMVVYVTGSPSFTLKWWVSDDNDPDFSGTETITNKRYNPSAYELNEAITPITEKEIDTAGTYMFTVNTYGQKFINLEVSGHTGGTVSAWIKGYNS